MEQYFLYSYYDEDFNFIGVYREETPTDILEEARKKFKVVKTIRWN